MNAQKRKTKGTPDAVDIHVGKRLRVRRSLLGMSQEKLAEAVGLTFQQIQKYEHGLNRISAGRLFQFSKILQVPISYFFDNFGGDKDSGGLLGFADQGQDDFIHIDVTQDKDTIDVIKIYHSIDQELRKDVLRFMKALAVKHPKDSN